MKISVYLLALLMLVFVSCKDSSQDAEQVAPAEQAIEAAPAEQAAPAEAAPAEQAAPTEQAAPAEEENTNSGN